METLTLGKMERVSCGYNPNWCEDSSKFRWVAMGVMTLVGLIPVAGVFLATPSIVAISAMEVYCAFQE